MKKIILTLAAAILAFGVAGAQDLKQATEVAQAANEALQNGDYVTALEKFTNAYDMATKCGDEGLELVDQCKSVIPTIGLNISKGLARENKYDEAIAKLKETLETAEKFEDADVASEAGNLINQLLFAKGNDAYEKDDFATAVEALQAASAADPDNGQILLRLGQALIGKGDMDAAEEVLAKAAANGQEENANKILSNTFLKKASVSLKAKDYKSVLANVEKHFHYGSNPQAYKLAASAYTATGNNNMAIESYQKYLEVAPDAKDTSAIKFTIAATYQKMKNKAKAKEYYQMIVNDPKFGENAKKMLAALK